MNLLKETEAALESNGLQTSDVAWVGSADGVYSMPWADFKRIADVEYDNGYGAAEIAEDLVVVGRGWWMERREYDGAEGWSFKTAPVMLGTKPFTIVSGGMWSTLEALQGGER